MNGILLQAGEFITKKVDGEVISEQLTTTMELSDRIGYALQRTLIGLIIVFGVLATIWLLLSLFKFIFYKDPNKKSAEKKTEATSAPASKSEPVSVVKTQDDGAVIAAIVAAISTMRNEQGIVGGFRVVSFKRGANKPWNKK
ncbi:MAG: OadG family protein [Clostridia bacterium]|nr:OadG family protein [Clostridia bacterium]